MSGALMLEASPAWSASPSRKGSGRVHRIAAAVARMVRRRKASRRKVVAITAAVLTDGNGRATYLGALCDDGSLWSLAAANVGVRPEWRRLPLPPGCSADDD